MKKYISISIFALFLLGFGLFSSNLSAKGIKEKVADSYYESLAYKKAIPYYVELAKSKRATAEIIRKTADSYNKIGDTANAITWYRTLYDKNWANTSDKYELFLLLRKAGKYEESLPIMNNYLESGGVKTVFIEALKENPNYIQDLKNKNVDKYNIIKLPFNSEEHDFAPTYYEDGIIFTTPKKRGKRVTIQRKYSWDNTEFLQLYYVAKTGDGEYAEPTLFTLAKKDKYHDGPIAFNSDFTEAYLTRSNYSADGKLTKGSDNTIQLNLYTSERKANGNWSKLKPFRYNSPDYSIGSATISKEGDVMVFASDMPGGEGETDLWMCKRIDGEWSTPVHLGDKINTSRRDNYPWLDKDGNLYFASDGGLKGMGGYDVFWIPGFLSGRDKVYNVGAPINSEADDFGFVYDSDSATGYFNSGRPGVVGTKGYDDIFAFEKLVSLLEVKVVDKETKKPITNALGCIKAETSDLIEGDITVDNEAIFHRELAPGNYIACASAEGYDDGQVVAVLPRGKFVESTIELSKVEIKVEEPTPCPEITLDDIYYDFDKYFIRGDASSSLDDLVDFLREYPEAKIKLVSHTDSRGTHKYNDWLSQKRAESAANYIVEHGIDRSRILSAHGEGERSLVNHCSDGVKCSAKEHQANRRTTVEIIIDGCVEVNKNPNKYQE